MAVSPEAINEAVSTAIKDIKDEALDFVGVLEDFVDARFADFDFSRIDAFVPSIIPDAPGADEIPVLRTSDITYDLSGFDPNLYKQATYLSEFFAFLEPNLTEYITNGGLAVSQEVQDAMFEQLFERDRRSLNDALLMADKVAGRTGFPMPTHMLVAARNELIGKFQDLNADRSKEIAVIIADRTQSTIQHAITSGINMEKVQSDFALGFAKLYMDMSNAVIAAFKAETEAYVAEFEGQVKALMARVEINVKNAEMDLAYQNQLMKKWEIDLTTSIEKTKAYMQDSMEGNKLRLAAAQSTASFYSSAVLGISNQMNAVSSVTEDVSA